MYPSEYFSEAVFAGGKEKVMPIVENIQAIKDELDKQIGKQDEGYDKAQKDIEKNKKTSVKVEYFNPTKFWKNTLFKDLEDKISSIFGFRSVQIHPYIEKYNSKDKMFESKIMNCEIYHMDRFPVEGLVSDKGFFDKSHSITMQVYVSLGLIKTLTAEEILAVLLHEFGHSIDPALVDIKYTEVNILSKYLTDRKKELTPEEKKMIEQQQNNVAPGIIVVGALLFLGIVSWINKFFSWIHDKIIGKEEVMRRKVKKIEEAVKADKTKFDRQTYTEAYADNFARMYGFGPQLIHALTKLSDEMHKELRSRYKKEKERQDIIIMITEECIKDVHKTDIHRIHALLDAYKEDLNDPNISAATKKQIKADMEEVEKILHEYLNNYDEFQNRINSVIDEELSKGEALEASKKEAKKEDKKEEPKEDKNEEPKKDEPKKEDKKDDKPMNESHEIKSDYLTEEERKAVKKKYGEVACSFGKDKKGYYCYTHRARSKSYPSPTDIPKKNVEFVSSTA